jgi:hypothetical protein
MMIRVRKQASPPETLASLIITSIIALPSVPATVVPLQKFNKP